MLFLYTYPIPLQVKQSRGNERLRDVTIDDTMVKSLSYYRKPQLAENVFKKRRDNWQPKSIIFEIISEKPTMGQPRHLPFRWHCTIRFSIDDNVNILSRNLKTIQTCLILKFHHNRLVSMNNIYLLTNSIQHYIPLH